MPMNEIYTLLQNDVLQSTDEMIYLLEKITDTSVFESVELLDLLDRFKLKPSGELIQKIKSFHQSTCNVNLKIPDIREVLMN